MLEALNKCTLCPRACGVNRLENESGFCYADSQIRIARAALHQWEEPCISGERGSETVFFSYCNLKCIFCQNYQISQLHIGEAISIGRLSEIFLELQIKGAYNINLVTPTHYVPQIIEALKIAKNNGLNIPIVYNSSGYDAIDTIRMLNGFVDIYLPDLKYYDENYSTKYSNAPDYFKHAKEAILEMVNQVGTPVFDDYGIMQKGVIVRHLMLPGLLFDSKKIIDYLYSTYKNDIYISLMNQYTPLEQVKDDPVLNRKINSKHYEALVQYALGIGVENGFIQEGETAMESFIPHFSSEGVKESNRF